MNAPLVRNSGVKSFAKGCEDHVELQTNTGYDPSINIAVTASSRWNETVVCQGQHASM
jgi:hypothetical protein